MDFDAAIKNAADSFKKEPAVLNGKPIGVVSHNDTDGVTSAAILATMLSRQNIKFHLFFTKRTEEDFAGIIEKQPYSLFILSDYGTKEVESFSERCPEKKFYVLDHHLTVAHKEEFKDKIIDVNPNLYGIDGATEVCAAGVCYLFAKAINEKNKDLSFLAIVGAIGDSQAKSGSLKSINIKILDDAISLGLVEIKKGLNVYGWSARPIHKALEYSTEPYIPGVSGSESSAVQFLQEMGIELKKEDGSWKTISDLPDDELKKIATGIIMRRQSHKDAGNIFAQKIFIPKFKIKDLSEAEVFSAWLNSSANSGFCGNAVAIALGSQKHYEESKETALAHKKELVEGMKYFYENYEKKNNEVVKETEKAIYFIGGNTINPNLTGTLATIMSKDIDAAGKPLIIFADDEKITKISTRLIGTSSESSINLGDICNVAASELGGVGGGHKPAAGANIPHGKVESFINLVENQLTEK